MKLFIRSLAALSFIFLHWSILLSEEPHSGKYLFLYGNSAASIGRGGAGVAGYGADLFSQNPATAAAIERVSASIQYGTLSGSYYNPETTLLIPSSYGVFGGSFRMISVNQNPVDIEKGYMFTLGAGRDFTDHIAFGISFNVLYSNIDNNINTYVGSTVGALYDTKYSYSFSNGFGIYNPRFALSVNAGLPIGKQSENVNMNQPTAGYSLGFYKNDLVNISLYNDLSFFDMYDKFSVKGGLESVFRDSYIVRVGSSVPQKYEYGDFTAGLGYRFKQRTVSAEINYAIAHYRKSTFVHYLGITAEFGELDRTPPSTAVKSSELYISPNHDGVQDYALINLNVKDRSRIKGWQLQILDSRGILVKEFKAPDRDMIQSLTFSGFFRKIISRKESEVVPENVMWDGADASGNIVSDGRYSYSFMAWDERDNYSEKKSGEINLDKTSPVVELKNDDLLFSPNGDKKKDELVIYHKVAASSEDNWAAAFTDITGKSVRSYKWKGTDVPAVLKWNGKDDSGNDLPEGLYSYTIQSRDRAGNSVKRGVYEISLTRKFETADISVSREYFSFKNAVSVLFKPSVSSKQGMTRWQITIENDNNKPVKVLKGEGAFTDRIEWDVIDENGNPLGDGKYYYSIRAVYLSGNEPASFKKQFFVDSTSPELALAFNPRIFSPDGDGDGDVLSIMPEISDNTEIADWSISIMNPSNILFKEFSGKGEAPKEFKWDGISDRGELVESASDYNMIFTATDRAGNLTRLPKVTVPVDVLVVVTERGLKIRISNIEFGFDSAKILTKGTRILNRVSQILDRYAKYKVLIEGHTDDIGDENYNLKLSEQRAQAVQDFLIQKGGVDRERLNARGMGETSPFVLNKDDESRRKNRRVEFILEKAGSKGK